MAGSLQTHKVRPHVVFLQKWLKLCVKSFLVCLILLEFNFYVSNFATGRDNWWNFKHNCCHLTLGSVKLGHHKLKCAPFNDHFLSPLLYGDVATVNLRAKVINAQHLPVVLHSLRQCVAHSEHITSKELELVVGAAMLVGEQRPMKQHITHLWHERLDSYTCTFQRLCNWKMYWSNSDYHRTLIGVS